MLILNKLLKAFQALSLRGSMAVWYVFKFMIGNLHLASNFSLLLISIQRFIHH